MDVNVYVSSTTCALYHNNFLSLFYFESYLYVFMYTVQVVNIIYLLYYYTKDAKLARHQTTCRAKLNMAILFIYISLVL